MSSHHAKRRVVDARIPSSVSLIVLRVAIDPALNLIKKPHQGLQTAVGEGEYGDFEGGGSS